MSRTRILLVDDHELFRAGLRAVLAEFPEFEVVGEAPDAHSAFLEHDRLRPDLTLMDIRLPGTDGIAATRELCRRDPGRKVAILSAMSDPDVCVEALEAGACGFFLKIQPVRDAVGAIRKVMCGETYLPPALQPVVEEQRSRLRKGKERAFDLLSVREKEVFRLLVRGKTNQQVARELYISVKTVESHREHILKKLGLHSVVELVRFAAREQLLDDGV
jgi:two-component system response regulator NreC